MSAPNVTASRLGCWQCVDTHYTAVFPPGFGPDPSLVARIRGFFPRYVPVWMVKEYVTPSGGVVNYGFHVIGRWEPFPPQDEEAVPLRIERPSDFPFHGGVIYEQLPWSDPPNKQGKKLNLPDLFRPFDVRLVDWMDAAHREMCRTPGQMKEKFQQYRRAMAEAEAAEMARTKENARLRLIDDRHHVVRLFEQGKFTAPPREAQTYVQAEKVMEER